MEGGEGEVEVEEVEVVVAQRADPLIASLNKRLSADLGSNLGLNHTSKWD